MSTHKHKSQKKSIILCKNPKIKIYPDFISLNEATHLINLSKDNLSHSVVVSSNHENPNEISQARSSSSYFCKKSQDQVIKQIELKIAKILHCTINHLEPLQVVHYRKNQQYLPHYDAFEKTHDNGQRVHTFLIYLNSLEDHHGGATTFPKLNLKVQPTLGTALYFRDLDYEGNVHPLTLHAAEPIITDTEKWACNVWIRDRPWGG